MNKRQKDKRIKRKWQMILGGLMFRASGVRIKPSRIKTKMIIGNKDVIVRGTGGGKWWHGAGTIDKEVIAWQPLPKPYREQKSMEV